MRIFVLFGFASGTAERDSAEEAQRRKSPLAKRRIPALAD